MMNREIKIEIISDDDKTIKEISRLHKNLFDKNHFTSIFSEELLNTYLRNLLDASQFKYSAILGDELVGYLIAGTDLNKVLTDFSRKYYLKLLFLLIKNPRFLYEKFNDLVGKIFLKNSKSVAEMRLFLIAAKRNENLTGVGKELIQRFEQDLKQNNISLYGLSVRKHNSNAIKFYLQLGFTEEFRTKKSIYFIKKINAE